MANSRSQDHSSERNLLSLKRQRQREHIYESVLAARLKEGLPFENAHAEAERVSNAKVNAYRADLAEGKTSCKKTRGRVYCRTRRGPKLVGQGGSRRQWYPGKKLEDERWACLEHKLGFPSREAWVEHMRLKHAKAEGLGDVVERAASKLGIKKCGGCERRRQALNRWFPFRRSSGRR